MAKSREIHLAARPHGVPQPADFRLVEVDVPEPADGEVLIRNAYFDNVGGATLEVALSALRQHGRVVACGAISQYNATERPPGPRNMSYVVTKRLRIEGFIVIDHFDRFPAFLAEVGPLVRASKVQYRETVVEGIENAPDALLGLLSGENIGKMLVRIGPDA